MSQNTEVTGTLEQAMRQAVSLLKEDPALAEEQAIAILEAVPGHPPAELLQAQARRQAGDSAAALALITALADRQPRWAAAQVELGISLGQLGRGDEAIGALRRAVALFQFIGVKNKVNTRLISTKNNWVLPIGCLRYICWRVIDVKRGERNR